jgi:molybdate/tungstate transport system substrate-binding protein
MVSRRTVVAGAAGSVAALGVAGSVLSMRGSGGPDQQVTALVAGSLLGVATDVPGATVEAHGSAAVRRFVLDGLREPDAIAVADPRLLTGIVDEMTVFATNALVIAYDPDSAFAADLQADWVAALDHEDIRIGRTDPQTDPLGYRTVLALRLAAEQGFGVDPASILGRSQVFPETELMNVLERGDIDAAFAYRNMAVERDLPAIDLPAAIDFSAPSLAERYASVSITVQGQELPGAPIRYAAAPLTMRGKPWVESLVTGRGRLEDAGFVVPADYPERSVPV